MHTLNHFIIALSNLSFNQNTTETKDTFTFFMLIPLFPRFIRHIPEYLNEKAAGNRYMVSDFQRLVFWMWFWGGVHQDVPFSMVRFDNSSIAMLNSSKGINNICNVSTPPISTVSTDFLKSIILWDIPFYVVLCGQFFLFTLLTK